MEKPGCWEVQPRKLRVDVERILGDVEDGIKGEIRERPICMVLGDTYSLTRITHILSGGGINVEDEDTSTM